MFARCAIEAIRTTRIVSETVLGHKLKPDEKHFAGTVAHYAMDATAGVIYGTIAKVMPGQDAGTGLPFGAAVWLVADEGIVPVTGLSKSAAEYLPSIHAYTAYTIASHFVYGLATEVVQRVVRQAIYSVFELDMQVVANHRAGY